MPILTQLKRAVLWLLGAALTVFMYTDMGLLVMLLVMVPIFIVIALKTPRRLP